MILAGKKVTCQEALHVRFVSSVFKTSEEMYKAAKETANQMIGHPISAKTLPLFKKMVKYPQRMTEMESVHEMEMGVLTDRITNGETLEAISILNQSKKSKLWTIIK